MNAHSQLIRRALNVFHGSCFPVYAIAPFIDEVRLRSGLYWPATLSETDYNLPIPVIASWR